MLIRGTVELDTDDIVDKSEVFRITKNLLHYSFANKLRKRFLMKKKSKRSCLVKNGRTNAW